MVINFFRIAKIKELAPFVFLVVLFVVLRLPGLALPFHQDEMKTALWVGSGAEASSGFHHPPLTQLLFRAEHLFFGADNFRMFILVFALLGALLAAVIAKERFGRRAALTTFFLLAITAYSVLASLMVDTDGAILPFFFLLSVYFYYRFIGSLPENKFWFLSALLCSLLVGFLIKLSFVLVIGAIFLDYLWHERQRLNKKILIRAGACLAGLMLVFVVVVFLAKFFYPSFSIDGMITHARSFVNFGSRGWLQIVIQAIKAVFYLSPLLVLLPFLATKDVLAKARLFLIYLGLGFIFYFIVFDFSQGALDKYLMFMIMPLAIIGGATVDRILAEQKDKWRLVGFGIGMAAAGLVFFVARLPHLALALYPKTVWFANVASLKWNILFPLTGGSGPLGFYLSFLMVAVAFGISGTLLIFGLIKFNWRALALMAILMIGVVYNAIVTEELLRGSLYGSAPAVLDQALDFIQSSKQIAKVVTYNDAGAYELNKMGKYAGRFYAVPAYEEGHKEFFAITRQDSVFLVVEMPRLYEPGFYSDFFKTCQVLFEAQSGNIPARVYDCRQ